jgi:predicted glutamine amidotransferase
VCQLFALTSHQPVSPDFSLRGFFQRGGNTGDHKDGWGLALFRDGQLELQTHISAAHNCHKATALLQTKPRATTVVAHIRKATAGEVAVQNAHPFTRTLWGETWAFAHNGDLKNFRPPTTKEYSPRGQTDSELAFCYILSQLARAFPRKPPLHLLAGFLRSLSANVSSHGTFNYLLSNGTLLISHCSTELYWAHRHFPFGKVELVDLDMSIDLNEFNQADESMFVVATKPLTRGEAWCPMGPGEIRIFEAGHMVLELPPMPPRAHALMDWNTAWESNRIVIS